MMGIANIGWVKHTFKLQGSIIPAVMPRVFFCGGFGVLISVLYARGWIQAWPILGNVVPSIVLGLLLVFRTNTAYDRFWEGRKAWGVLVNTVRNLTRRIWVFVEESEPGDRFHKQGQCLSLHWGREIVYAVLIFIPKSTQYLIPLSRFFREQLTHGLDDAVESLKIQTLNELSHAGTDRQDPPCCKFVIFTVAMMLAIEVFVRKKSVVKNPDGKGKGISVSRARPPLADVYLSAHHSTKGSGA